MTTTGPLAGRSVLLGAALGGLATAVITAITGFVVDSSAGLGALCGGLAAVVVLGGGTWVVLRVASTSPTASLVVALVVFTFQGLLLAGVLGLIKVLTDRTQTTAAAFAVIAVTLVWTTAFAVLVRRARIPIFDLSILSGAETGSNPSDTEGANVR